MVILRNSFDIGLYCKNSISHKKMIRDNMILLLKIGKNQHVKKKDCIKLGAVFLIFLSKKVRRARRG